MPAYHGQALLTTLPIRSSRMLRFATSIGILEAAPAADPIHVRCWQRREGGRIALITELDNGGKPLVIYNLHLESRGNDHLRLLQLEEVLDDAKRYPPETPVIIAGDLNTKTAHSALIPRMREAGYRSAFGDRRVRTHILIGDARLGFRPRPHRVPARRRAAGRRWLGSFSGNGGRKTLGRGCV